MNKFSGSLARALFGKWFVAGDKNVVPDPIFELM